MLFIIVKVTRRITTPRTSNKDRVHVWNNKIHIYARAHVTWFGLYFLVKEENGASRVKLLRNTKQLYDKDLGNDFIWSPPLFLIKKVFYSAFSRRGNLVRDIKMYVAMGLNSRVTTMYRPLPLSFFFFSRPRFICAPQTPSSRPLPSLSSNPF